MNISVRNPKIPVTFQSRPRTVQQGINGSPAYYHTQHNKGMTGRLGQKDTNNKTHGHSQQDEQSGPWDTAVDFLGRQQNVPVFIW